MAILAAQRLPLRQGEGDRDMTPADRIAQKLDDMSADLMEATENLMLASRHSQEAARLLRAMARDCLIAAVLVPVVVSGAIYFLTRWLP